MQLNGVTRCLMFSFHAYIIIFLWMNELGTMRNNSVRVSCHQLFSHFTSIFFMTENRENHSDFFLPFLSIYLDKTWKLKREISTCVWRFFIKFNSVIQFEWRCSIAITTLTVTRNPNRLKFIVYLSSTVNVNDMPSWIPHSASINLRNPRSLSKR